MDIYRTITYQGIEFTLLHWEGDSWVYRSEDGSTILKVAKTDFARRELKKEACLLPRLKRLGFPVPELIGFDSDGFLLEERISGLSLSREKAELQMENLRELVGSLAKVKQEDVQGCGLEVYHLGDWKKQLFEWAKVATIGLFSKEWLRRFSVLVEDVFKEDFQPVFLHGDLVLRHILVDESGKFWIIDWSDSFFSDPVYDLSFVYYSLNRDPSWLDCFDLSEEEKKRIEFYSYWLPALFTLDEARRTGNREEFREGMSLLKEALRYYGFI